MSEMASLLETIEEQGELRLMPLVNILASSVEGLREVLKPLLDSPAQTVVLDLSNVRQIDSLGVSLVVGLFKTCEARGAQFRVEAAMPDLLRVFRLFRLNQYFSIMDAQAP